MNKKLALEELGRLDPQDYKNVPKLDLVVILDNVRSMHNVGAVFRTSDAFLIKEVILAGFTPSPPHRDIRKVALGATETVEWRSVPSGIEAVIELKNQGYSIVSIEQTEHSTDLSSFHVQKGGKYAVVLGNEVDGVSQEIIDLSDFSLEIPQFGTKHSLNVSVCAGIVLWAFSKELI